MSDEPKVIWAITQYRGVFGATGTWREVGSNDGRTPYIRTDAPELLAMVDALRAVEGWWLSDDMKNSFGAPVCIFETRSAITAWEKLTK